MACCDGEGRLGPVELGPGVILPQEIVAIVHRLTRVIAIRRQRGQWGLDKNTVVLEGPSERLDEALELLLQQLAPEPAGDDEHCPLQRAPTKCDAWSEGCLLYTSPSPRD